MVLLTKKISECPHAKKEMFGEKIYCANPKRDDKGEYGFCISTNWNIQDKKVYVNTQIMRCCQYKSKR